MNNNQKDLSFYDIFLVFHIWNIPYSNDVRTRTYSKMNVSNLESLLNLDVINEIEPSNNLDQISKVDNVNNLEQTNNQYRIN